jgi:hypothetical protein
VRSTAKGPRAEFAARLKELFSAAGSPNLEALGSAATAALASQTRSQGGRVSARLPVTAKRISAWKTGENVPADWPPLESVLNVLIGRARRTQPRGISALYALQEWRRLWEAARQAPAGAAGREPAAPDDRRPLGRLVRELVDPLDLEVHPAIDAGARAAGLPAMPQYIPRPHDQRLRDIMRRAEQSSCLIVLIGGSSSGKTRVLWEALQVLPAGWRLWHPIYPDRASAVLNAFEGGQIAPRTVLWLNEAQLYLDTPADNIAGHDTPGERAAAALRELLRDVSRAPILVLATLWPEHWDVLEPRPSLDLEDPHAQARELLAVAEQIRVREQFTDQEMAELRVAAARDPRLGLAHQEADGKVTQFLAGAFELVARYQNAPSAASAVITAAMDALRLGYGSRLPEALLRDAAPGYLDDDVWQTLDDDWFTAALRYAGRPSRGIPGPLTRFRSRPGEPAPVEPEYRLADYLDQHGRSIRRYHAPPESLWGAVARHANDNMELQRLASAASRSGRLRHAAALHLRAVEVGGCGAEMRLAALLERAGDVGAAESLYRRAAAAGSRGALIRLTVLRELAGDHTGAEEFAQQALAYGYVAGLQWLAAVREKAGDLAEAVRHYQRLAEVGDRDALVSLAVLRGNTGDANGAQRAAEQAAAAGRAGGLVWLAAQQEEAGDRVARARLDEQLAKSGDTPALLGMAEICEGANDHAGAEQIYELIARTHGLATLVWLAGLKEQEGAGNTAKRLYQWAADRGDTDAMLLLADLREQEGDLAGAQEMAERAAAGDDLDALTVLAELRERAGDVRGAEQLADRASLSGDPETLVCLGELRESAGDYAGAEVLYRRAHEYGDAAVVTRLARLLDKAGDRKSAEEMIRQAVESGHTEVWVRLAEVRERAGDRHGAEEMIRQAVDAGFADALEQFASLLQRWGSSALASRLQRFGMEADGRISGPWRLEDLAPRTAPSS